MPWEEYHRFDTAAKRVAARARVAQGMFAGETIGSIARDLRVAEETVRGIIETLTIEWTTQEVEVVDRWKKRLLTELEGLKAELYRRYAEDETMIVSETETQTTGARPGTVKTKIKKPLGLDLDLLKEIRAIITDQRKILGIDAPVQVRSVNISLTAKELKELSDEQLDALIVDIGGNKLLEDITGKQEPRKKMGPKLREDIE